MRCLALFTGGLDSLLAVRLMQDQGIEVVALYLASPFVDPANSVEAAASKLGIELVVADLGDAYAQFLRQPRFGYISGAAACTDCRIAMMAAAREKMTECGAEFVVSGELAGQRPRTAIRDLEVVAHHAGLADLLVRPLSAQLLPPTSVESRSWVNRSQLLALQGKSRRPQQELARKLGLEPLPPPRPDCPLLAGPLAEKTVDLVRSEQSIDSCDLELLTIGRHHRLDGQSKVIVARSREEGARLAELEQQTDKVALLEPDNFNGPVALLIGDLSDANLHFSAGLLAARSRIAKGQVAQVRITIARRSRFIPLPETTTPPAPIGANS